MLSGTLFFRAFASIFRGMQSTRPPSIADMFADGNKLRDLYEVVGMVVTNFGGIEETLRYLDWQLKAFDLAAGMPAATLENDLQIALGVPRTTYFGNHLILSRILTGIDDGFARPCVANALGAQAITITSDWQRLKATVKDLGNRRNALAHAAIGISGASPVRSMGLLAPAATVNTLDNQKLIQEMSDFRKSLGVFINNLDAVLPFRDHNKITFFEATA